MNASTMHCLLLQADAEYRELVAKCTGLLELRAANVRP